MSAPTLTSAPRLRPGRHLAPVEHAASRSAQSRAERRLLFRYHCEGDAAARDELVERCMPLSHKLARRYMHGSQPLE